jgi:hypothetical protein
MKAVERPSPVLVAALNHDFDGFANPDVGFDSRISQVIESAQDVVVPKRREREPEPALVDDFAGSERTEHATLEHIVFSPLARLTDGHGFAPGALVFEQSFEHANSSVERRAPALGCFAVPAAVVELLAKKLTGQCIVRFAEIRADGQDSAVDAGLRFAAEVRPVIEPLEYEPLLDAVNHLARLLAGGDETEIPQDRETVESNKQVPVLLRQIASPPAWTPAPVPGSRLPRE